MSNTGKTDADKLVLDLLNKVDAKRKQIGAAERPQWITTCAFRYDTNSNAIINIQTVKEISDLVEIFAFLENKKTSIENAAKQLGVTVPSKHLGFSIEEWQSDIKCRINGLQIKAKRDELASLEARVNALVSPEQRREIELQKLVAEIG